MSLSMTTDRLLARLFAHAPRLARYIGTRVLRVGSSESRYSRQKKTEDALSSLRLDCDLATEILRLPDRFALDVMELQYAPESFLAGQSIRIDSAALDQVKAQHRLGKGLVLGCANFGCYYRALLACKGVFDDILVVVGTAPSGEQEFRERLERLSSARIRLVPVARHSGVAIARQLARGGVVATMLDTYLPGTERLIAPFLGRDAASPTGIYQLVTRMGATIVPVFCLRRHGGMEIEIGSMIDGGVGKSPFDVAKAVNDCIGAKILAEPEQWMMWHTLTDRWAAASTPG